MSNSLRATAPCWYDADTETISISFRYDNEFVKDCQRIVGRKWDGDSKTNTFPITSAPEVKVLTTKWAIRVDDSLKQTPQWDSTPVPVQSYNVMVEGKSIVMNFAYQKEIIESIHDAIPGATWNNEKRRWQTSLINANDAVAFAETLGWTVEPQLFDQATEAMGKARENQELSATLVADPFPIPGLNGELRPYQFSAVDYSVRNSRVIIADDPGLGKGHPVGTNILTPNGWKKIENLSVGDKIIGSNGGSTKITGVNHRGILPVFKVSFNDGSSVRVDGDHLWNIQHRSGYKYLQDKWRTVSTRDLSKDLLDGENHRKWKIPIVGAVEFEKQNAPLPIAPYLLGLLLGDGAISQDSIYFTSIDEEILEYIRKEIHPLNLRKTSGLYGYHLSIGRGNTYRNPIITALKGLGLMGHTSLTKFVPQMYLLGTPQERMEILQGIMDTDGNAGPDGTNEFVSASKQLADDVTFLVLSLGGIVRRSIKTIRSGPYTGNTYHRVNVKTMECPFRLSRKVAAWKKPTKYKPSRSMSSIEPDGEASVICLSVDAPDRLYVTEDFIVTHNSLESMSVMMIKDSLPCIIVCKSKLKGMWRDEVWKWFPDSSATIINGTDLYPIPPVDFIILNYDIAHAWYEALIERGFKSLIVDESHYIKNGKRSLVCSTPGCGHAMKFEFIKKCPKCKEVNVKAKRKYGVRRTNAVMQLSLSLPDDAPVLLLTGTPLEHRPAELVRQLECIDRLQIFGGDGKFKYRYCGTNGKGASNSMELHRKLRENCYVRRRVDDVFKDLPPEQYIPTYIEIPEKSMERYREVERDVVEYFAQRAAKEAEARGSDAEWAAYCKREQLERVVDMVQLSGLRGVLAEIKRDPIVEWIKDFDDDAGGEEKLVIFGEHISLVDHIYAEFANESVALRGTDAVGAQENAKRFQTDPTIKKWVANLQASKEGFTLTASSHVIFCELPWSPMWLRQGLGRARGRANDPHHAIGYGLLVKGTVDEEMWAMLDEKRAIINAVTDGIEVPEDQITVEEELRLAWMERGKALLRVR
jgi:hypothetical protein